MLEEQEHRHNLAKHSPRMSAAAPLEFSKHVERAPPELPRCVGEIRVIVDTEVESASSPLSKRRVADYAREHLNWDAQEPRRDSNTPRLLLPQEWDGNKGLLAVASSTVAFSADELIPAPNGFLTACHIAYSLHHPLRLRPDDIWLPIVQSVAQHIDKHAEVYRDAFVDFDGKARLVVEVPPEFAAGGDDSKVEWADLVHTFSELVREHTRSDVASAFAPSFSTADAVSRAAAGVAVMAAMKSFFEYTVFTFCGIREVVLEGTPADWDALRARTAHLATLAGGRLGADLRRWFELLDGTLSRLAETAHGAPNTDFWRRIYSSYNPGGSGATTSFSGWALHFFLYSSSGKRIEHAERPVTGKEFRESLGRRNADSDEWEHCDVPDSFLSEGEIPAFACSAPVEWQSGGSARKLNFISGSWGVGITRTGEVTPVTQWVISEAVVRGAAASQ